MHVIKAVAENKRTVLSGDHPKTCLVYNDGLAYFSTLAKYSEVRMLLSDEQVL